MTRTAHPTSFDAVRLVMRAGVGLVFLMGAAGCDGAPDDPSAGGAIQARTGAIHANPGSTISKTTEPNTTTGAFPQVVYLNSQLGCTGTVIAPYTVLSAAHCIPSGSVTVDWNSSAHSAKGFSSPYLVADGAAQTYAYTAYTPDWIVALNQAPAMHDQAIFFVPDLTPQFLAANHLNPIALNPSFAFPDVFTIVGVASTGGTNRDSIVEQFVPANVGSKTYPPDGFLTCDNVTTNFGSVDHGDSGGPHFATKLTSWTDGSLFAIGRTIVATSVVADCSSAPLAYSANITETANQRSTVRLNSLWAMARADDADGDGLPNECDSDPANAVGSVTLCPAALGAPSGAATASAPAAQLQCPFGMMPVGLKGTFGTSINTTAIECDELECFFGTACTGTRTISDSFGINAGNSYETVCPAGERMVGLTGTSDSAAIYSLTAQCLSSSGTIHSATTVGKTTSGTAFASNCAGNKLTGFQAHSTNKAQTTGLQALCSPVTEQYLIGPGPGQNPMQCPPGQVALGIGYSVVAPGADVQMTGLLCGEKAAIAAGQAAAQIPSTVLRSAFEMGNWYPAAVEPHSNLHVPPTWTESLCPTGSAMSGLTIGWDTTSQPGYTWVSGIQSMQCQDIRTATGATTTVAINAGNLGGANQTFAMLSSFLIDGYITCDAQLQCGMMLHASAPPAASANLAATSITSAGVNLTWSASSTSNVTYRVFRSTSSSFSPSTTVPIKSDLTGLTYLDPTPTPSTTNYYYVLASNPDGLSFPSNKLAVAAAAIPAPAGLTATAQFDSPNYRDTITLAWNASSIPNATYAVFRGTVATFTPSTGNMIVSTTSTTYKDDGTTGTPNGWLTAGTKYYYFVEVTQSGGSSPPSNQANATAPTFTVAAPTGLVAVASFDASTNFDRVTLTWNANSNPNTIYDVYRSATANFTPSSANFLNNTVGTSYADEVLLLGQRFYYRVVVEQYGGAALSSNEASATTPGLQIDCGSATGVSPYVADELFSGTGGTINHANQIDLTAVTNPAPMVVYQTARLGPITYTSSGQFAPNSSHTIRLHFAETWGSATTGTRQFNVKINATQVLTSFDILAATAGVKNKAIVKPFTVNADASGSYAIQFTNVKNVALISAIEIQ